MPEGAMDVAGAIRQYATQGARPQPRQSSQRARSNGDRGEGRQARQQDDGDNANGGMGHHLHIHYHGGDGGFRGLDGRAAPPAPVGGGQPAPAPGQPTAQTPADQIRAWFMDLAQQGRHGDTMLAHINPQEANLLEDRGGAGTINPDTGLPEFYAGSDFSGGDRSYQAGNANAGAGGGANTGGGGSSGSGGKSAGGSAGSMGSTATGSAGQRGLTGAAQGQTGPGSTSSGTTGGKAAGNTSGTRTDFSGGSNTGSGGSRINSVSSQPAQPSSPALTGSELAAMMAASSREAQAKAGFYSPAEASQLGLDARNIAPGYGVENSYDVASKYPSKYVWQNGKLVPTSMATTNYTPQEWTDFTTGLAKRKADYSDVDNSFLDNIGNFLLGATTDIREQKPDASYLSPNTDADWAFDPVGTVAGMAYRGAGIPASIISGLLGRPLAISLGPDVFGDTPSAEPSNISKSWDAITGGRDYSLAGGSVPAGYSQDASGKWVANPGGQGAQGAEGAVSRAVSAITGAAQGAGSMFSGGGQGTAEGAARFGNVGGEGGARGADTGYAANQQRRQQQQQQPATGPTGPTGPQTPATGATGATGGTGTPPATGPATVGDVVRGAAASNGAIPFTVEGHTIWMQPGGKFTNGKNGSGSSQVKSSMLDKIYTAFPQYKPADTGATGGTGTSPTTPGATGGTNVGGIHGSTDAQLIASMIAAIAHPGVYARPPLPMPTMTATNAAQDAMLAAARQLQGVA